MITEHYKRVRNKAVSLLCSGRQERERLLLKVSLILQYGCCLDRVMILDGYL